MRRKFVRREAAVFAGICVMALCAGCGQKDDAARGQEISGVPAHGGAADEAETDRAATGSEGTLQDSDGGKADEAQEQEKLSLSAEEAAPDEEGEAAPENGRRLTETELTEYTEWIQDTSNYGFLLSEWENPAQIDLYQVFYNGAGIARQGTEEEQRALLERYDQPEIYTDFQALDRADVSALLSEKVGLSYDELVAEGSRGMADWYYAETDSFCSEHGDTNYVPFLCTGGIVNEEEEIVTLYCDGDDWVRTCEVKVRIAPGERRFLGNHITEGLLLGAETFSEAQEGEKKGRLIEESVFENLSRDADASAVENAYVLGDWSRITKEALQGVWYHHPNDVGESKEYDVVLQFEGDRAVVYYPAVEFYGDAYYEWDIVDRSERGLCPELAIYWRGTKEGELAWYILGISEDRAYFWCNGEVFYRQ